MLMLEMSRMKTIVADEMTVVVIMSRMKENVVEEEVLGVVMVVAVVLHGEMMAVEMIMTCNLQEVDIVVVEAVAEVVEEVVIEVP